MHSTRRLVVFTLAALLLGDPPLHGQTTRPDVDKLLADLGSDDWKQRQHAADALAELDASALPRLKQAVESTADVDVRNALVAAVRRIEEVATHGPTRLNLDFHDAPAVDVLHAIGRQLAYPLTADNEEALKGLKLSVKASGEPFWSVLKRIAAQSPLRPAPAGNDPSRVILTTSGNNLLNPRAVVAGPFVICPTMIISNQQIDLMQDKPQGRFRSLNLSAAVLIEPKLRVSRMSVTARTAVDENGKSLLAGNPRIGAGMRVMVGTQNTVIPIRMQGGGHATAIAKLTGVIRARVPARTRRVELPVQIDNPQTVDLNGRTTKVSVHRREEFYEVKIQLPPNTGPADEASITARRDLSLIDQDGRPLLRRQFTQTQVPRGPRPVWEYRILYARQGLIFGRENTPAGEPAKLIWDLAVEHKDLDVPFELTNIPLVVQ